MKHITAWAKYRAAYCYSRWITYLLLGFKLLICKFHNAVCTVHVYQFTVYKCALTCTVKLYSDRYCTYWGGVTNSSVLKGDAKYSDMSMTRQKPSNSGFFWAVVLFSLMLVVAATETCRLIWKFIHKKISNYIGYRLHS